MAWTEFETMLKAMRKELRKADFEAEKIDNIIRFIREEGIPNPPEIIDFDGDNNGGG